MHPPYLFLVETVMTCFSFDQSYTQKIYAVYWPEGGAVRQQRVYWPVCVIDWQLLAKEGWVMREAEN